MWNRLVGLEFGNVSVEHESVSVVEELFIILVINQINAQILVL